MTERLPRHARLLVAGLAATQTVSWGVLYYAFSVLLVPMQRDLHWSRTTLIGGFTAAIVLSGLVAPYIGLAIDRGAARIVFTSGSILAVAAVLGWSQARSPLAYYGVWVLIGCAMGAVLYDSAFSVLAKRTAPFHRRAITAVTLVAGLSSLIFQPLTGALARHYGWRTGLLVLAGILAAVTIPIHVFVLKSPDGSGRSPATALRKSRIRAAVIVDRRFWFLTAALAVVTAASMAASVLLIAYLVDHGWSLGTAAFAGGALGVMQLPGRIAFGHLARRLSHARLATVLFLLPGAGILVLLASNGGTLVWPAVGLLGVAQGANTLLRATIFVDLYGPQDIGVLNGLSSRVITLGRAVAPLGAGFLVAVLGSYTVPYLGLTALCVAAAGLSILVLVRPQPDAERVGVRTSLAS